VGELTAAAAAAAAAEPKKRLLDRLFMSEPQFVYRQYQLY
jgi:hypothetical protein